jgi:flavorubredoxin
LTLKSGRVLEFLFAPYLHSPGAIVTYDPKTRSLFTSDIFGAVSKDWSLFASGDYLGPMKDFHQLYMPCNRILKAFMERLLQLDIDRILPQHGSVLEGDQVRDAINYLMELPCGVDLMDD